MITIPSKAKVKITWKVSPYDFSIEKQEQIRACASKKYNIPKEHVKVEPDFITINENGDEVTIANDVIDNIQDPQFQLKLFKEYILANGIENADMEAIEKIDKDINARIDYNVYDKFKKFSIKWVKWSNFQSYGKDNYFDFSKLKDIVLLNGEPANQSGKTTFAVDLLHFLLFGKTAKANVQEKIFNKFTPEETNVVVEGCLVIEGEEYVIKRTLSRPSLQKRSSKSKVTQKVDYYKIVGGELEELEDYIEIQQGEDSKQTNKIIKESIGREEDFDLIMCITGSNLDSLIDEKPTDRGRLFSRWVGLLPLEEKEAIAKELYNTSVKPHLMSNFYNRETLKQEIEAYLVSIEDSEKKIKSLEEDNKIVDKEIETLENSKSRLLSLKQSIDESLLKLDISTIKNNLERTINEGVTKKNKLEEIATEIKSIGDIEFSVSDYDNVVNENLKLNNDRGELLGSVKYRRKLIDNLKTSEYCPTCHRKLDNIDNSAEISKNEKELADIVEKGKEVSAKIAENTKIIESMKINRDLYNKKNSLEIQKSTLEMNIEQIRSKCKDLKSKEREYNQNAEAIDKNNSLDIEINNTNANILVKRKSKNYIIEETTYNKSNIENCNKEILSRKNIITKIGEEESLIATWKIYLDMVGKNGISKMVMRKTLPIINARLVQLLDDVCDFNVEVVINNKNEVAFNLIKDGVSSDLDSGSGFEKTASALALRSVLSDISTIPKLNFIVLDELLGRVAKSNFDNMHTLYERISKNYDFVIHITHLDEVKDWHSTIITVAKDSRGVSSIKKNK